MLVLLIGLPGVGKSTLARALVAHAGGCVVSKDSIRDCIFPQAWRDYTSEQNELAAGVAAAVCEYILRRSPDEMVVADGRPFVKVKQRMEFYAVAERSGSPVKVIHCIAPDAIVKRRLHRDLEAGTVHPRSQRNYEKYLRLMNEFEDIGEPHLVLDTSMALSRQLERCLSYLAADK